MTFFRLTGMEKSPPAGLSHAISSERTGNRATERSGNCASL
jgi:hypothetical protein